MNVSDAVPSDQGVFSSSNTRPSGSSFNRGRASAGRARYRHSRSLPCGLCSRGGVELVEQALDMELRRVPRDPEDRTDLAVRHALGQQLEDLLLPGCQGRHVDPIRSGRVRVHQQPGEHGVNSRDQRLPR